MALFLIVIEEHGIPVELFGRDIDRAIASGRLRSDTIVRVHETGMPATTCLAQVVPQLRPLFGLPREIVPPPPPPVASPPASRHDATAIAQPLLRGQNVALADAAGVVRVVVGTAVDDAAVLEVDVSAFLLGDDGQARADADFIYYNNDGRGGAVHRLGETDHPLLGRVDRFDIRLDAVEAGVRRICFAASIYDAEMRGQSFRHLRRATIAIDGADGQLIARYDFNEPAAAETALILGEFYRRGMGWKFRAVGQGYLGGLGALATAMGIDVQGGG